MPEGPTAPPSSSSMQPLPLSDSGSQKEKGIDGQGRPVEPVSDSTRGMPNNSGKPVFNEHKTKNAKVIENVDPQTSGQSEKKENVEKLSQALPVPDEFVLNDYFTDKAIEQLRRTIPEGKELNFSGFSGLPLGTLFKCYRSKGFKKGSLDAFREMLKAACEEALKKNPACGKEGIYTAIAKQINDMGVTDRGALNSLITVLTGDQSQGVARIMATLTVLDAENKFEQLSEAVRDSYHSGQMEQKGKSLDKIREKLFKESGIPHYNAVVVGAGPAGMMAALELAEQGNKVCVLESRSEEQWDIRSSILASASASTLYIAKALNTLEEKLGPDHVFSHKKKRDNTHSKSLKHLKDRVSRTYNIQTDVVQRILKELAQQEHPERISIKHQSAVEKFDPWLQTVKMASSDSLIAYDSIVHADGASGTSQKKLINELGLSVEYDEAEIDFGGRSQCAYLQCSSFPKLGQYGDRLPVDEIYRADYSADLISRLKEFDWDSETLPQTYIYRISDDAKKVWIAGQAPTTLKPEDQLEWNRLLCCIALSRKVQPPPVLDDMEYIKPDTSTERGKKKEILSHTIFDNKKKVMKDPIKALPFGHSIAIGDTRETPNFHRAEGLVNALMDVEELALPSPYRSR